MALIINSNQAKDISVVLTEIKKYIEKDSLSIYFAKIKKDKTSFLQSFDRAIKKLNTIDGGIKLGKDYNVYLLRIKWNVFASQTNEKISAEKISQFQEIYSDTRYVLNFINSIPKLPIIQKSRPAETITEDLQNLEARRKSIQQQMDRGGEKGNSDEMDELQKSLKNIESQILTMRKERDEAQKESQIERNWDEKIQQAFTSLKECTEAIEQQKDIASQEYQRITNMIYVLCVIVLVWVLSIYKAIFVTQVYFNSWISFLPYYLPIPLFIVVFWVLIVQKNRANKLGITLSNEIYQIRYMEGLLLATNKLSINSETSISRINKAIDVMIESYLHQVEHSGIDENSIEKIEKKELNSNKYMHIIEKLLEKL